MTPRRTVRIALVAVIILAVGFLAYRAARGWIYSLDQIGEPSYSVELKDGNVEIRRYEGFALAETTAQAPFRQATGRSFSSLFRYISGNNRSRPTGAAIGPTSEKIAMTAPVLLEPTRAPNDAEALDRDDIDSWTMAFILPSEYTLDNAPQPTSARVDIRDVEPRRVASIRFSGRFTVRNGETHRAKLADWLSSRNLSHRADWKLAGYDPPFTLPILRRNEVLVTLR